MAGKFLAKSRHGTIYYFRRRVPAAAQDVIGRSVLVHSLETCDRRLAIIRGRALAAQTDVIFQRITMAKKSSNTGGFRIDYTMKIDLNELGLPSSITVDAQPEEQEAVNAAIRTALESAGGSSGKIKRPVTGKPFGSAISEYFTRSQIKPQSKATYRSKLDHARQFFGESNDVLEIDQADFVSYCDHVLATVTNTTSQGHYMSTVVTFLNWHRHRTAGLPALTTKTLVPRKDTPESEERDAFSLEQLRLIFANAKQYWRSNPYKFWVSVAPVFLGCRIEELCQVHLGTDLIQDEHSKIWYLVFDGRADPDGIVRKSMKKLSSWRSVPIHPALIRHGFVEFLQRQREAGFNRPFEKEWKAREDIDPNLGRIIKWSHYISRWGSREFIALAKRHQFGKTRLSYFHSMRHSFKIILGEAGVSSEISEALSGRRYGGADAERYGKLKQNHARLYNEGIEPGLAPLEKVLDEVLSS